jgi:hypothetical protein
MNLWQLHSKAIDSPHRAVLWKYPLVSTVFQSSRTKDCSQNYDTISQRAITNTLNNLLVTFWILRNGITHITHAQCVAWKLDTGCWTFKVLRHVTLWRLVNGNGVSEERSAFIFGLTQSKNRLLDHVYNLSLWLHVVFSSMKPRIVFGSVLRNLRVKQIIL